jgi:hypothetical protein
MTQEALAEGPPTADQHAALAAAHDLPIRLAPPRATPQASSAVVMSDEFKLVLGWGPRASQQMQVTRHNIEGEPATFIS